MSTSAKNRSRLAIITYGGVVTVNADILLYVEIDSLVSFDNGIEMLSSHRRPASDLTAAGRPVRFPPPLARPVNGRPSKREAHPC